VKRTALLILLAGLLAVATPLTQARTNAVPHPVGKNTDTDWYEVFSPSNQIPFHISLYSHEGLYFELVREGGEPGTVVTRLFSEERRLTGRVGGKIHIDGALFNQDGDLPEADDGIEVRRGYLDIYGRSFLVKPVTYGIEFGITDGRFYFNDGYIWFHDLRFLGSAKLGLFKAPLSLESLESSSATTFMEIGSPVSAFAPGYKLGAQLGGPLFGKRATLYGGWFADAQDYESGDATESNSRLVGRVTWLPILNAPHERVHLLHVGASGGPMFASGDGFQYRSRPENNIAPYLVDTGLIAGEKALIVGAEAAWLNGPFSLQGEFLQAIGDREDDDNNFQFGGFYVYGSWFITGESKRYDRDRGIFKGIEPRRRFSFRDRSWGAWELAARYSHLDLTDGDVRGGVMNIVSGDLTCYLSKFNRIMLGCAYAEVDETEQAGDMLMVQSRLQVTF
jgi:phosphate-selective porin OprO/OprP